MGKDLITNIIYKEINKVLNEGIDFDEYTHTVSYNPTHEDNVDTSLQNNPTLNDNLLNGVEIWSIFKRKRGNAGDGNPLLYAIKGERRWTFKTRKDRKSIYAQINAITDKFIESHSYDITIVLPSTNTLNAYIASLIKNKAQNTILIDDLLLKSTIEDVDEMITQPDSSFFEKYGKNRQMFNDALMRFREYCKNMPDEFFRYHYIPDLNMRKVIENTIKIRRPLAGVYANAINDKNVLLLDDSITQGNTILSACNTIKEYFSPNTISVLTLFSRLY